MWHSTSFSPLILLPLFILGDASALMIAYVQNIPQYGMYLFYLPNCLSISFALPVSLTPSSFAASQVFQHIKQDEKLLQGQGHVYSYQYNLVLVEYFCCKSLLSFHSLIFSSFFHPSVPAGLTLCGQVFALEVVLGRHFWLGGGGIRGSSKSPKNIFSLSPTSVF